MTRFEMVEKLSERANVTLEEAKLALEACDWDLLDAALLLEKENGSSQGAAYSTKQEPKPEEAPRESGWKDALRRVLRLLRRALECGNRNHLEVRRKGELLVTLPVTVLVVFLLVAFWVCVPLLVVGLFLGCRYSFSGAELGKESVNRAMDHAADVAQRVKEEFQKDD